MPTATNQPVAYFCAEFGIDNRLPIYAGGLGILAADLLKAAADDNFPMVGVGLLYLGKGFIQRIKEDGWQEEIDQSYDPRECGLETVLVNGNPLHVVTNLAGEDVWINAYQKRLSENTKLILLTTNNHYNTPLWKDAMIADYCCDDENQLRQQLILGVGGVKVLRAMGINPTIYHLNEGRPIFLNWQLSHQIMHDKRVGIKKAQEMAKQMTVYTNHTLLKSGNLTYPHDLVKRYAASFVTATGIDSEKLIKPGLEKETNRFNITQFALNVSSKASTVSEVHLKLTQEEWPKYQWVNITNGVHLPTWQANQYRSKMSSKALWSAHLEQKAKLRQLVFERVGYGYDENRLVISWARRVASYKQLKKIFSDVKQLATIISNQEKPVQLLISGKGHYGDDEAKRTIQEVISYMQNELSGYALFIPNYNLELAEKMVRGSDVWLNTPEYKREACGTSGMKAIANGCLNLTVNDGWAKEVDWANLGWTLDHNNISQSFCDKLTKEIVPEYYHRNKNGLPERWVRKMRASIEISKNFSAKRMLSEYQKSLYSLSDN